MKQAGIFSYLILMLAVVLCSTSVVFGAADGYYVLSTTSYAWDGTDANRLTPPTVDYVSAYGDESIVTYNLPWAFPFYGQTYSQITADTNGNIWFGSSSSVHSFNLASNGRGPVVAAWNNDLSSYYYGGVFIQHKTGPERVVIAWQTETYTNEGLNRPNSFEAVLYPSGAIRLDYQSFTAAVTNRDFGSGSSKNDGSNYLSVTTGYGNVYASAGSSYQFDPQSGTAAQITLALSGIGAGSVSSSPAGLNCTANCMSSFKTGTTVTLNAAASPGSVFTGWTGGGCSTASSCNVNLAANTAITATFALPPTAGFSYTLSPGTAPATAIFTDISVNATSWSWNFGDGTTSTLQNPTHTYRNPGSYTASLTVSSVGGSATTTQNITVTACATQPVKIGSTYYATFQAAYDAAVEGDVIQSLGQDLTENLSAGQDKYVILDGGYLCGFGSNPDTTVLHGAPRLSAGTVKLKNIRIAQ